MSAPPGTALLARNMTSAIAALRRQERIVQILGLLGPLTGDELYRYCTADMVGMTRKVLERSLTVLGKVGLVLKSQPTRTNVEPYWMVHGQTAPTRQVVRTERRKSPRSPHVPPPTSSWWLDVRRENWPSLVQSRWQQ